MEKNSSVLDVELPTNEGFITIAGSRSYGTNTESSDTDYRGFFFPEKKHILGLRAGPENKQGLQNGIDVAFWEFRHFTRLAMNGNPNVLEALFTDPTDHVLVTPLAKKFLRHKQLFLSRKIANSFVGVAHANWKRIEKAHSRNEPWIGKDAMHMVRYLNMCFDALKTGKLEIKRSPTEAKMLLEIRCF